MKTPMIYEIRNNHFSRFVSYLLIFLLLLQTNSCYYYKAVIPTEPPPVVLEQEKYGSYIMLHTGNEVKVLDNITVYDDYITCRADSVIGHDYYKTTWPEQKMRYRMNKKHNESEVLNEVHLYVNQYEQTGNDQITIYNKDMINIVLYDPATGATIASWALGAGLGAPVGAYLLILLIVIITSCPFVYAFDGDQYVFSGEMYAGSIYPAIERHDYLTLDELKPDADQYRIIVANEIREIQHTNLAELMYVDHPGDLDVMIDKYGKLHTLSEASIPTSMVNLYGEDLKNTLAGKDGKVYLGQGSSKEPALLDGVIMEYDLPEQAESVKLAISAKNSLWLEYVYKRFHELLGDKYATFTEEKSKRTAEQLYQDAQDQHLTIAVYVEKDGDWEYRDFFNVAGPMAFKDDVLEIDVSDLAEGPVRIKLEYGALFWEVDYVGLDATNDIELELKTIQAATAIDENGNDVSGLIKQDDDLYYTQPEVGNAAEIVFDVPAQNQGERTVFLHSKGHYKILREESGDPETKVLKSMKNGDGLPGLSRDILKSKMEKAEELAE